MISISSVMLEAGSLSVLDSHAFIPKREDFETWNLKQVQERVCKEHPEIDVEKAIYQYRRYMYLVATCSGEHLLVCNPEVDIILHTHLLFTRDYINFCRQCAGGFIHHEPGCISKTQLDLEKEKLNFAYLKHLNSFFTDLSPLDYPLGNISACQKDLATS